MPKGTVTSFEAEKGFGKLVLETGEEMSFDISVSNKREPPIGGVAEVTLGIGRDGKPKAKLVLFELEEDRAPSFAAGFKQLQKHGFLVTWDAKQAKAAAKELLDEVPSKLLRADVGGLFQSYYGEGLSELGRAEGVITLDWRFGQSTRHPSDDLLALCPEATKVELRTDGDRVWVLGEVVDLTEGLEPLVEAMNASLARNEVDGRFFSLDFESDFYVIAYRPRAFADAIQAVSFLKLG